MKDTYYVRRNEPGEGTRLFTKMSTPRKSDALYSAAESAIVNPGYYYYVYKNGIEIAKFHVEKEN